VATTSTEVNSRKKRRRNEKTLKQGMVPQRLERRGEGSLDLSFVNVLSEEADVLERLKAFGVSAPPRREVAEHSLEDEADIIPNRSRSENVTSAVHEMHDENEQNFMGDSLQENDFVLRYDPEIEGNVKLYRVVRVDSIADRVEAQEYSAFGTIAEPNAWDEKSKMPLHDWRWRPVWFDSEGRRVVREHANGDMTPARTSFSQMEVIIEFRELPRGRIPQTVISALRGLRSVLGDLTVGQDRSLRLR